MALDEKYDFHEIERKWQARWDAADLYHAEIDPAKPKYYGLEMFPYPSGSGLSVGHFKNYAPTDAFLRLKSMQGFNVLHPMGWDAFGLPAENEALKRRVNPGPMVREFAANYKRQINLIGMAYDWDREINSSNPAYYKWTQWIFLLLYKQGLAYRQNAPVNWDPVEKTVLANEEVVNGRGWRSGALVEKRYIPQWYLKVTAYAERLLSGLDGLDWPEGVKQQQRNWIGRSEGAEVTFQVQDPTPAQAPTLPKREGEEIAGLDAEDPLFDATDYFASLRPPVSGGPLRSKEVGSSITVFTTRPDTLWGATFLVLAPEHPLVDALTTDAQQDAISAYVTRAGRETEMDRQAEGREKTGVFTGAYAVNPVNGEAVPIWIADYVLMGYGTGAIMAVPAHDQRDFDFARKFGLAVVPVYQEPGAEVSGEAMTAATTDKGVLVNSGQFNGLAYSKENVKRVAAWLEEQGTGKPVVTYRFRDWLVSRQRYWGVPIPIIHCPIHGEVAVPDDQLPVLLPDVENYQPTGTGEGPLAAIAEFVETNCPICGGPAKRETDTMAGTACSSWYFLRFADPNNADAPFSREAADYWLPVDTYVGGAEHAVSHLLYSRFWTKVLHDAELIGFDEPYRRYRNQGMMLAYTPGRNTLADEEAGETEGDEKIDDWKAIKPEDLPRFDPSEIVYRWAKMSKSSGNVVTPDEAAERFGADSLRVYEMFVAPFDETVQWSEEGIRGSSKFLARVYRLAAQVSAGWSADWRNRVSDAGGKDRDLRRKTHQTLLRVADDLENFRFNTAVAGLMEWTNAMYEVANTLPASTRSAALDEAVEYFVLALSPFAPHLADELWTAGLGQSGFLYHHPWPQADPAVAKNDEITLVVQVNGKVRDKLTAPADLSQSDLQALALASPKVVEALGGNAPKKIIVVAGKLVNVVI